MLKGRRSSIGFRERVVVCLASLLDVGGRAWATQSSQFARSPQCEMNLLCSKVILMVYATIGIFTVAFIQVHVLNIWQQW